MIKTWKDEPFHIISPLLLFRHRRVFANLIFNKSNPGYCSIMDIIHVLPKVVYFAEKGKPVVHRAHFKCKGGRAKGVYIPCPWNLSRFSFWRKEAAGFFKVLVLWVGYNFQKRNRFQREFLDQLDDVFS